MHEERECQHMQAGVSILISRGGIFFGRKIFHLIYLVFIICMEIFFKCFKMRTFIFSHLFDTPSNSTAGLESHENQKQHGVIRFLA